MTQAARSLTLLSASGLLTVVLHNLGNQNFGFQQDRRTVVGFDPLPQDTHRSGWRCFTGAYTMLSRSLRAWSLLPFAYTHRKAVTVGTIASPPKVSRNRSTMRLIGTRSRTAILRRSETLLCEVAPSQRKIPPQHAR